MLQIKLLMTVAFVLTVSIGQSYANDDPWFFTADEIAHAFRYQVEFGARLRNPLAPQDCLHGQKDFTASYQGRRFVAPCRFISETVRQIRELFESGAAKYLFALDVDYGDLAVPAEVYASKYQQLARDQILPALLHEPTLITIYHTAVHLRPELHNKGLGMNPWGKKRTVIGFYDGRPNQVLTHRTAEKVYSEPDGLVRLGSFMMMAHYLGELSFVAGEAVVTFDLSFDNDRAPAPSADIVTVSTAAR
jgi:hypothetical protein